jgi:uncharacterized membrane protein YhaH (DUF805 family)
MVSEQPSNDRAQAVQALVIMGMNLARQGKSDAAIAAFDEVETRFGKDDSPDVREWVAKAREARPGLRLVEDAERTPSPATASWGREPRQPDWASAPARPRQDGARQTAEPAYGGPYCELPIFSMNGRLGRMRFMAWNMVLILVMSVFTVKTKSETDLAIFVMFMTAGLFFIVMIVGFVISICASVRRLHDMNLSGWWVLFLPVLNGLAVSQMLLSPSIRSMTIVFLVQFLTSMLLCVIPGNQGVNDYGHPPPPNSSSVYVLAGIFILGSAISLGGMAGPEHQILRNCRAVAR